MHRKIIVAPDRVPDSALRLRVLHVGDGDGFRTKIMSRPGLEQDASVRFGFIDAPELSQRGGPEARDYLKALIGGKTLDVAITHKTETGNAIDRYGRIVGVPFLSEASISKSTPVRNSNRKVFGLRQTLVRNVELEMVLNGWAWVLSRYDPDPVYFVAQDEARRLRLGIWAFDSNLTPWDFKKQVHRGRQPDERFLAHYIPKNTFEPQVNCPSEDCSGQLKLRMGKRGKFLSCTNFPKCKHTRPQ
jgi:micrococcal nuclease